MFVPHSRTGVCSQARKPWPGRGLYGAVSRASSPSAPPVGGPAEKPKARSVSVRMAREHAGPRLGRMTSTDSRSERIDRSDPSASFSATLRVHLENRPGSFALLAEAIAGAGGLLDAIDLVRVEHGRDP